MANTMDSTMANIMKTLLLTYLPNKVLVLPLLFALIVFSASVLAEKSVCAVVKIEIIQELTLERQGFEAELRVANSLDDKALDNISIDVWFKDENELLVLASSDPNNVTAKFYIRVQSLENIDDVTGSGVIAAGEEAQVKWLIVPVPGAANGRERGSLYFVGADFNYSLDGVDSSISVAPDTIYVKPMPLLTLDYFIPQDVVADDPFTPSIEPPVPFTLGVRVQNNGIGDAKNLKIDSAQPKIVENEQGLLINFELLSSYVGNQQVNNSLLLDFDDIKSNQSKVGRWQMEVPLSGKFTEFSAQFSHASDLGGQLTSLLTAANTHFLIQDVVVDLPGRDVIRDFLAEGLPNPSVYESDGSTSDVVDMSAQATLLYEQAVGEYSRYKLSMPVSAGLFYLKVDDPQEGDKELAFVTRSDGKTINSQNAWLSAQQNRATHLWSHYVNLFDGSGTDSYYFYFKQRVIPPSAPIFAHIPQQTTYEGGNLGFLVAASDPDGNSVSFSAAPLPMGATFVDLANDSGQLIWSPTIGQAGRYTITYLANDGNQTSSKTALIVVNSADDIDGDGLLDEWELLHFGDLTHDGFGDYDGDGISNQDEHDNNTNPAVPDGPPTPTIFSPAVQGETTELNPELIIENGVYGGPHQISYRFELYGDPAVSQLVDYYNSVPIDQAGLTRWTPGLELQDNSYYYWRVRAFDGYTYSQWANGDFFVNTLNDLPVSPVLSSPQEGSELGDSNALLEVSNASDVDDDVLYYEFMVYSDIDLQTLVTQSGVIAESVSGMTAWALNQQLNDGQRYYWQVKVTDEHNEIVLSDIFSFIWIITNQAPPAPQVVLPQDNDEIALTSTQLIATTVIDPNGDTLSYHYQVDRVNTFDSVHLQVFEVEVDPMLAEQSLVLTELQDNQVYYWRVKAVDPQLAQSYWSSASFFVNTINEAPSLPTIKNPGDGAWVDSQTPFLELYPSTDIDRDPIQYQFELYLYPELTHLVQSQLVTAPELLTNSLGDNTWYYWRAKAIDDEAKTSDWTNVNRFFVNDNNFDDPPGFNWIQPLQSRVLYPNSDVILQWSDWDPDSSAVINLFYSLNPDGSDPSIIVQGISEDVDNGADNYSWNIGDIPYGTYYLFAQIFDEKSTVLVQAPGLFKVVPEPFIPGNVIVTADPLIELYEVFDNPQVGTFSVKLDKQPKANVVVPIVNPFPTRLALDKSSLTFRAEDWDIPQFVTITPINNCDFDSHINFEIMVDFAMSADEAFNGIKGNNVKLLLYNDDPKVYEIDDQYLGQDFTICGLGQVDSKVIGDKYFYQFVVYGKNHSNGSFKRLVIEQKMKKFPILKLTASLIFSDVASHETAKSQTAFKVAVEYEMPVINWLNPEWYSLAISSQQTE
jgi:hypothetical protein